jgi:GAF domain-containing protein
MKQGSPIGNILIWRDILEPFTDRQIELVKTFADQAVIAIENVRLFKEIQERNSELREALGASDGDVRGAWHYQPLADGRPAGSRCYCRECGTRLRNR